MTGTEGVQIVHTPDAERGTQLASTPGGDEQLIVRWAAPVVVDDEIVVHRPRRSPLDEDGADS